jgi:hypothetical protein
MPRLLERLYSSKRMLVVVVYLSMFLDNILLTVVGEYYAFKPNLTLKFKNLRSYSSITENWYFYLRFPKMHKLKLWMCHPHVSVRLQFCVSVCFISKPTAGFWQKRKLKVRKAEIFLQVSNDFTACNPLYKVWIRWQKILTNRRSQAHGNMIQFYFTCGFHFTHFFFWIKWPSLDKTQ